MEIGHKNFNVKIGDVYNFYFIGDIHEGNVNHAEKELKQAVKIIAEDPNGYWIGMGDYVEAITIDDKKRFNPVTVCQEYGIDDLTDLPYKQMERVFNKLKPIEKKCLALLVGNHEESYIKYNHANIYDRLTEMFTTPPVQIGYVGFFKLGFIREKGRERPNITVLIALNHGQGGGGFREGYPINKVHDTFRWTNADVNVMAHIHQLLTDDKKILDVTQKNKLKKKRKYFGASGCFLYTYKQGNKNYFEHKGKYESDIGFLQVSIKVTRDEPEITMIRRVLG
jgi:hypothetical protein